MARASKFFCRFHRFQKLATLKRIEQQDDMLLKAGVLLLVAWLFGIVGSMELVIGFTCSAGRLDADTVCVHVGARRGPASIANRQTLTLLVDTIAA